MSLEFCTIRQNEVHGTSYHIVHTPEGYLPNKYNHPEKEWLLTHCLLQNITYVASCLRASYSLILQKREYKLCRNLCHFIGFIKPPLCMVTIFNCCYHIYIMADIQNPIKQFLIQELIQNETFEHLRDNIRKPLSWCLQNTVNYSTRITIHSNQQSNTPTFFDYATKCIK